MQELRCGSNAPGREDVMHWDVWYDLAILELSELSDPAKEKLVEAEKAQGPPAPEAEEPPTPASTESA
jgi:hypothetical protein